MRITLSRSFELITNRDTPNQPVKRRWTSAVRAIVTMSATMGIMLCFSASVLAQHYQETKLVSDIPGFAANTDAHLVNPWGLTRSATSPWWVSDNGTGLSTLYNGTGGAIPLVVTIPVPPGGTPPSTPTGTVFNGTSSDFKGDRFIFVTEDGTVAGWSGGSNAVLRVNNSGAAIYKGVTIAQNNGSNFLFAANFFAGTLDVFDNNYMPVSLPAGAFSDQKIPDGFAPFNVQNLGGVIWVTFAKQGEGRKDEADGPGLGYVDAFDGSGRLLMRLKHGSWMNAPWGIVATPDDFGKLSNRILVGQFGSGQIASFDPDNGNFHGLLRGRRGRPLTIDGLWALMFGNGGSAGPTSTLFFTAGIDDEQHGLFGTITPIPGDDDSSSGN